RQAHQRHPQRVDDHDGSRKSQAESRKLRDRRHVVQPHERIAREREPEHHVGESPHVQSAERHEPLRVHRLGEHQVETAAFHLSPAPSMRRPRVPPRRYPTNTSANTTPRPTNPCTSPAPCTAPLRRSTGNPSMYGNPRNPATRATAGGSRASGASRPERNSEIPACSSMMAVARVVQNASSPVAKLMKNRSAAASSTAAAVSAHRPAPNGSRTSGHAAATMSHTTRIMPAVRALYAMFSATASCAG